MLSEKDEILLDKACQMVKETMRTAITDIDDLFQQQDFAASNPTLVAAYMHAASAELSRLHCFQKVEYALSRIADTLDK